MILWYIDESGITKDERYIAVGGYCIEDELYEDVQKDFRKLKEKYFLDVNKKLDMKKIIQGQKWARLIPMDKRKELLKDFYKFIDKHKIRIALCMVDRENSPNIRNKLKFSYECLFERICLNVEDLSNINKKLGILFTDTMTNHKEVESWFETFYIKGTEFVTNNHMIEKIVPLKMSQSEMLQIADMIVCTCTYWQKANNGQKSVMWAKEILEDGWKIILKKEKKVKSQDEKKEVSSIYFYYPKN